ncbi:NAD(P)-dependent dehydrogenase, short-chain alcohol dehydrogenase family [Shimia gijangensis]|uniref:NAD(P)-dependent dehydrogenase, short-chain alcohol dehydrogenase family n=1 Tax=Shimia gijangensis TaxID=1470563 RepID=A0A1M6UAQ4_9RHOB|nr:SDR family oxidoreductase [Shimia gijangensis]SHK66148.1 NAD(P)-dependent dehydrogenase, short-chain alcohol dehydrogenase family [Shimia gijangensis]
MTVAIIGGTSGIGLACAHLWRERGKQVAIFGRSEERLNSALAGLGSGAMGSRVDASDPSKLDETLSRVQDLQVLVISVGAGAGAGTLDQLGFDGLKKGFEQKVLPVWNSVQCGRKHLAMSGAMVILGAARAHHAAGDGVGLAAVHGAIASMIPSLAKAMAPIRVNLVAPGVTDTPPWNGLGDEKKQAVFDHFAKQAPLERVGQPEEIAQAIVSIASNTFTTGQVLRVDGGLSL